MGAFHSEIVLMTWDPLLHGTKKDFAAHAVAILSVAWSQFNPPIVAADHGFVRVWVVSSLF